MSSKLPALTYNKIYKNFPEFEDYRGKLKLKGLEVKKEFVKKYPDLVSLLKERNIDLSDLRKHSAKVIGAGALTGALLMNPPLSPNPIPAPNEVIEKLKSAEGKLAVEGIQSLFIDNLKSVLPSKPRFLYSNEEKVIEKLIEEVLGIKTKANLEGEHLNTTYGYIGAEQHLRRFPGDTLTQHGEGGVLKEGIAPGLGAWGYFASTKDKLSNSLEETEKWYAVVQTLYLPDWSSRQPYLRNWYKYRKVLIVNTQNGNAVVAAIADSGPAAWTGKQFGGSPEVMDYLGGERYKKGSVLIFFVDDPENKIPLGPWNYNQKSLPNLTYVKT